ncbi:hypothetical protein D3C71_1749010 [compost metagenome]
MRLNNDIYSAVVAESVINRIFHQRLEQEPRHCRRQHIILRLHIELEFIIIADTLQLHIIADCFNFFANRHNYALFAKIVMQHLH